jgi:hypothetical protein
MRSNGGSSLNASSGTGAGCMTVFGLAFFGAGALVVQQAIFGRVKQGDRTSMGVFGSIFAIVGATIIAGGIWSIGTARRQNALRAAKPDEPWLWSPVWVSGMIPDKSGSTTIFSWIFAAIWNCVGWPAAWSAISSASAGSGAAYFALLLPAIGVATVAWAIYLTIRRLKFGRSTLELETLPGCIGGWFAGTIQTRGAIFADQVHITLRCIRRTTSNSKNSHTTDDIEWGDEQNLVGRLPTGKQGGSAIPVSFSIPPKCIPTESISARSEILWKLLVHAPMPGADYVTEFVIPVFDAPQTQAPGFIPAAERAAAKIRDQSPAKSRRGDDSRIRFAIGPGTRKRFTFSAARNFGAAVSVSIIALAPLLTGTVIFPRIHAPMLLSILLTVVGAAAGYWAVTMWFREYELSADTHGVERRWNMLGFSGGKSVAAADVASITYVGNMQINDTTYFTIDAKLKRGKTVKLASGVKSRDAAWIAGEVAQSLGVECVAEASPSFPS